MVVLSSFFVALLAIIFVFGNKAREMSAGKPYLKLAFGSDFHLRRRIESAKVSVKGMPRKAANVTAYYAVKHGITAFEKAKSVIHPKIAHIIEAVKGKNIPKNKGSVSLFLKRIEEHQRGLK
jgi:hypothetical protein